MSQTGKLMPNLDQNTTKMLNLTVLQRMDPSIEEILITAAHVTFYEFNIETNQWSRKDVEGSLFVVKRNTQPRFQFIVMNRRSTDNLVENLLGDFEYEIQVPYLLYRNSSQEVNGIWFYNPDECKDVASLFSRILTAYSKVPAKPRAAPMKSEFEDAEAILNMPIVEGSLETSPASPVRDAPEDSAFANIFASALNLRNNASNVANLRQNQHPVAAVPLSSQAVHISLSPAPNTDIPSVSLPSPFNQISHNDSTASISSRNGVNNLLKPPSFLPPTSFSPSLIIPPISSTARVGANNPLNLRHHEGTPLLQPFPPPNPSPLLAPSAAAAAAAADRPTITREKIHEALLMLVQDERFIDLFYQTLMKTQQY